jgi:hypothetical protein
MDNRHKHIEKLINTLVVPKVNKILEDGLAPMIYRVEVDNILRSDITNTDFVTIIIHYKNPEGGKYVSISSVSYLISCMIVTILPYVLTGNIRTTIHNILKDNMDSSSYKFINFGHLESFNYYIKELQERV